jgi:hypothetical protein
VADDAHGLPLLEEVADEGDRVLVAAQEVRVRDPAGQDEPVVVGRLGLRDLPVDGERVALVEMVEGLDLT